MRLARVLRQLNRGEEALDVYREMARSRTSRHRPPGGARGADAEMRLLEQLGRPSRPRFSRAPFSTTWPADGGLLTSGQYRALAAEAARISGDDSARWPCGGSRGGRLLERVAGGAEPRGRMLVGPAGIAVSSPGVAEERSPRRGWLRFQAA